MQDSNANLIQSATSPAPEISVVIAAYNAEDFIEEAINSILTQQGVNFEIVVVDDASTDRTLDVLANITDLRLTIIRLAERAYVSVVRNRAALYARAPWLCVFDADDVMLPNRLAPYAKFITALPSAEWGYCGLSITDESLKPTNAIMRNHFDLLHELVRNIIPHPMSMIKRDLFLKVGGYDESLGANDDYDLWLRLLEHVEPRFYNEICLLYRRHKKTLGNTNPGREPVFERLRARLARTAPSVEMEKRRERLRACLAFLDAAEAENHVLAIQIGDKLQANGLVSFQLDRQRVQSLKKIECGSMALTITLDWARRILNGMPAARHVLEWALQESLTLAAALNRKDALEDLRNITKKTHCHLIE